jgi:hypothetical protein
VNQYDEKAITKAQLLTYLTEHISYTLDESKRKAIDTLFGFVAEK